MSGQKVIAIRLSTQDFYRSGNPNAPDLKRHRPLEPEAKPEVKDMDGADACEKYRTVWESVGFADECENYQNITHLTIIRYNTLLTRLSD